MSVSQTTIQALKNKDAELRALKVTEEMETAIGVGALAGTLTTATERLGAVKQTILTFSARSLAVTDALAYASTKVYDFPAKRILLLAASASLQFRVATANTTINDSAALDYSFGTAATASTSLASTAADVIPLVDAPLSATNGNLSTAAAGHLAASAFFAANTDLFLNVAFPTATEIDADGTLEVTGTITLTWIETEA